jgi:hypothetical protein
VVVVELVVCGWCSVVLQLVVVKLLVVELVVALARVTPHGGRGGVGGVWLVLHGGAAGGGEVRVVAAVEVVDVVVVVDM